MNPHLQQILHDITVRITKLEEAQQRTWVELTEEEILKFQDIVPNTLSYDLIKFAKAVEAKLKEKNL